MSSLLEVHRTLERLSAFVRRRVRDAHVADDIVQDVMLKLQESNTAPADERRLAAWLYRVARNTIVDHYRSPAARRRAATIDELTEPVARRSPDRHANELAFADCVSKMVRCLPEPYRTALWLADHEGLSQADVAARVGVSLSGVKSRVRRGRQRMREMIDDCCHVELDRRGGVADYDGCGRDRGGASGKCASFLCADSSTEATAANVAAECNQRGA